MNNLVPPSWPKGGVPELPPLARTRSGVEFDPRADRWAYRDIACNICLDFSRLPGITNSFRASVKRVLLWYAENMSGYHLDNMFDRLRHFLQWVHPNNGALGEIISADLINYKSSLSTSTVWYFGGLSGLLHKWHDLGCPGVTDDAAVLLKQLRVKGNRKGESVLTHDPEHGPFTDIEIQAIQAVLDKAFSRGEVSLEYYLLVYLYMLLGQRSIQYAALKVCDVGVDWSQQDGVPVYTLRVPRAKQRAQLSRTEFKDRVLIPQVGELLVRHANQVRAAFDGKLADPSQAPLFPAKRHRANDPGGFKYHRTSDALADLLEGVLNKLKVFSERTGQPMHITAIRFRRTLGTRAAMEGHGELIIAELLDHTDTQNVGVYVEAVPEIVERIDRAVAIHLAPLAQAFVGIIIEDESHATRCGDTSSRICDPRFDASMKPMGNCGKHGFCGFLAPISCYTCTNFQPWLDGAHEAVLDFLIAERDRLAGSSDLRIASVNDRTIFAVAEVVRQCQLIRNGATEAEHG